MGNYTITNGDGAITYSGLTRDRAFARAQEKADEHGEPFFVSPAGYESDDDTDLGDRVDPEWEVDVSSVGPATNMDEGVDAAIVVKIGRREFRGEVTLAPDRVLATVRRRHPLGACGSSVDAWADDSIIDALRTADGAGLDRRNIIAAIEHAVDAAAIKAGL